MCTNCGGILISLSRNQYAGRRLGKSKMNFRFSLASYRVRTPEWWDQNPLPYHLANPQCSVIIPQTYSLRNASTGSFFEAERDGISPAIKVKITESTTNNPAVRGSNVADSGMSPV